MIYERSDRQRPSGALLWIHGGGMVLGRPEQANTWCSALAADLDVLVVSVDYRLAPEHPFPDGLTDCYDALGVVERSGRRARRRPRPHRRGR